MPTSTQSAGGNNTPELQPISNSLNDMSEGGLAIPEQADIRVNSCEYVSFDYRGTLANDPIVAVRMLVSPIDGSNENKDFEIEWPTGAKINDFAIINDGGALASTGSRSTLTKTSNWALFLKSLEDASFDSNQLNGPTGIRCLAGAELAVRRIKQPTRSGIEDKNAKGYDKTFYTCLKIISLPGEKKKGTASRGSVAKPATTAAKAAQAPAVSSNGNGEVSGDILDLVTSAMSGETSMELNKLKQLVFKAARASKSTKECQEIAQQINEDSLIELAIGNSLNWTVDKGILTIEA